MNRIILSILFMAGFAAHAAEGPAFHWLFEPGRVKGKEVESLAGKLPARFNGTARIEAVGALDLDRIDAAVTEAGYRLVR